MRVSRIATCYPANRKQLNGASEFQGGTVLSIPHRIALFTLLAAIPGCSQETIMARYTPADADARARTYIAQIARGNVDSAIARLEPSIADARGRREMQKIGDLLRGENFDSTRVIGAQTTTVSDVRRVNLAYELHSAHGWFVASVATVDSANQWFVEGVTAQSIAHPLEQDMAFQLSGKSFTHYAWLAIAFAAAAMSIGVAVFLAFRPAMPKRWRWVLLSFVGVGAFRLNWATGAIDFNAISFQVGSASILKSGVVAPWILSFGIPVGAIAAFAAYRQWRIASLPPAGVQDSAPNPAI